MRMGSVLLHPQSGMAIPVQDIVCHSFYDIRTLSNDIALVLLAHSVNYSAFIQPVCLPERNFEAKSGTRCWVTGWGRQMADGETGRAGSEGEVWCPGVGLQAEGRDREAGSLQVGKGGGGVEAAWE